MESLLLIDEHALVRAGIRRLLEDVEDEAGTEIVAESNSGHDGIAKLREHKPDIVVMDIGLEGYSVFDVIRRMLLIDNKVKIIILTATFDASFPTRVLKLGVSACISKTCPSNDLYSALKAVRANKRFVSMNVVQKILQDKSMQLHHSPFLKLSNRELQITYLFMRAMDVHDISARLYLSPKTVSTYRYKIFSKLGVRGDVELMHLAMRHEMFEAEHLLPMTYQKAS